MPERNRPPLASPAGIRLKYHVVEEALRVTALEYGVDRVDEAAEGLVADRARELRDRERAHELHP